MEQTRWQAVQKEVQRGVPPLAGRWVVWQPNRVLVGRASAGWQMPGPSEVRQGPGQPVQAQAEPMVQVWQEAPPQVVLPAAGWLAAGQRNRVWFRQASR